MTGFNNTTQEGTWRDPVDASPGNAVEFRVVVRNIGDQVANNVQVIGSIPENIGTTLQARTTIQPSYFGAVPLNDTVTINILGGSSQSMRYRPGHARIFGVTNLFNCPNGCDLSDNIASTGLDIGNIPAGETIQVGFKADVTNVVSPTPTQPAQPTATATPTPTGAPTATPTVTPTVAVTPAAQGNVVSCPAGFVQTVSGSTIICLQQNQQQSQSASANASASTGPINVSVVGAAGTPTPTPQTTPAPAGTSPTVPAVQQLPKTGLPLAAWIVSGLLPMGAGLRRFGFKGGKNSDLTPQTIWQTREFEKE